MLLSVTYRSAPALEVVRCLQTKGSHVRVFRTQRGLSTHERSAHPVVRNQKRAAAAAPTAQQPRMPGGRGKFTLDELNLMYRMEQHHHGHPRIMALVKNRERVFVVDVTVRHEDGINLQRGREDKIRKYRGLIPELMTRMGGSSGDRDWH
ncbi:hypothetical protein J6590_007608 [Homalodisca vitripennis]|nr:hypothetical protein J6590_007608 [Homalodisca vitripennis]